MARLIDHLCIILLTFEMLHMHAADAVVTTKHMNNSARADAFPMSEEKRLLQHLMAGYEMVGRGGRPVLNISHSIVLRFGLGLIQMDLDEKEKVLTTSMWTKMKWRDAYLTWDPAEYGGVSVIRLQMHELWMPDIMLYNTADPESVARNVLVKVKADGMAHWVPHQIFRSSCSIDVVNFPFDSQRCTMWFGSWTHNFREIDLELAFAEGIDLSTFNSDYKESSEWDIIRSKADKILNVNDSNGYTVLSFELILQRKMVFSSYILTMPCVFLASLTLIVFCLPPERPDRTGLAMSIFSSFLVLLLILVEAAPSSASSVPKLGIYYCFNMVIIMMSIFLSSMVVNVNRAGESGRKVPACVNVIVIQFLGRLLCMCPQDCFKKRRGSGPSTKYTRGRRSSSGMGQNSLGMYQYTSSTMTDNHDNVPARKPDPAAVPNQAETMADVWSAMKKHTKPEQVKVAERWFHNMEKSLNEMRLYSQDLVMGIKQRESQQAHRQAISSQWKLVAKVLDRFFLFSYLVSIITSLIFLFPRPSDRFFLEG